MLISVYLHDFDIGLLWQQFEIGNWRIQTCIDCHPCIKKSQPTNQDRQSPRLHDNEKGSPMSF